MVFWQSAFTAIELNTLPDKVKSSNYLSTFKTRPEKSDKRSAYTHFMFLTTRLYLSSILFITLLFS